MTTSPADALVTSAEASEILGRRIDPYYRRGRIRPARRAGSGTRSPLLFNRADVERLRDQIAARLAEQLDSLKGSTTTNQKDQT